MASKARRVPIASTTIVAIRADGALMTGIEQELCEAQNRGGVRITRSAMVEQLIREGIEGRVNARKGKAA